MAGKLCPECGDLTFFESKTGRLCSRCGYTMTLPINESKGGKGRRCSNCGKSTVFEQTVQGNSKCSNCGATYKKTN